MKIKRSMIGLLLIALMAAACIPDLSVTGTPNWSLATALIEQQSTISALETIVAVTPIVTSTGTVTPTIKPTHTLTSTPVTTSTPVPTFLATLAHPLSLCNQAAFVADITIPDGTLIYPGNTFVKTWRLLNNGTCTWTPGYKIVYVSGDLLGGQTSSNLGINVMPGQTIDISLTLTSPAATGTYSGYYKLADASGNIFGIGANSDSAFYVIILDGSSVLATASLAVTSVIMSVNTPIVNVVCPPGYTFTFNADIVTNAPGTVSYHWIFSDGTASSEQSLTFSAAGDQNVSTNWTLGAKGTLPTNPYVATASIHITTPNNQTFGAQSIAIGCIFVSPTSTLAHTRTSTPRPSATHSTTP